MRRRILPTRWLRAGRGTGRALHDAPPSTSADPTEISRCVPPSSPFQDTSGPVEANPSPPTIRWRVEGRLERKTARRRIRKKRPSLSEVTGNSSSEKTSGHGTHQQVELSDEDNEQRAPKRVCISERPSPKEPLEPTQAELDSCSCERARLALSTFYERANELVRYRKITGDCNVPQKYAENRQLGIWVNKQRMEKRHFDSGRKTSLNQRRIAVLESIGFSWGDRKGLVKWEENYNLLVEFYNKFGHCHVPTKYKDNPKLGRWVSTLRSEHKKFTDGDESASLSQQQIDRLNSMGFSWKKIDR